MSRIGKKPVPVGAAKVAVSGQHVKVEGPKGKLELSVHPVIGVKLEDGGKHLVVSRPDDLKTSKALHGLTRALLANMIEGVTTGYRKVMEIQGVGYKGEIKGKSLVLSLGYANPVTVGIPANLTVAMEGVGKVVITGADKQAVGQFAASLKRIKKPEPYKGKGIRYEGERIKIKPGKAFAGAGAK